MFTAIVLSAVAALFLIARRENFGQQVVISHESMANAPITVPAAKVAQHPVGVNGDLPDLPPVVVVVWYLRAVQAASWKRVGRFEMLAHRREPLTSVIARKAGALSCRLRSSRI